MVSKLATVVIHAAAVHEREAVLNRLARKDPLSIEGADSSVGQGSGNDRESISITLKRTALGIIFDNILYFRSLRESIFRFH